MQPELHVRGESVNHRDLSLYLLAVDALQSEQLLVAGQAVVARVLLDEAPGSDWLLAAVAGEAGLVPTVALVLHLFRAW